jgi:hypothetical protein
MGDPTRSYIIHATADPAMGQLLAALDRVRGQQDVQTPFRGQRSARDTVV